MLSAPANYFTLYNNQHADFELGANGSMRCSSTEINLWQNVDLYTKFIKENDLQDRLQAAYEQALQDYAQLQSERYSRYYDAEGRLILPDRQLQSQRVILASGHYLVPLFPLYDDQHADFQLGVHYARLSVGEKYLWLNIELYSKVIKEAGLQENLVAAYQQALRDYVKTTNERHERYNLKLPYMEALGRFGENDPTTLFLLGKYAKYLVEQDNASGKDLLALTIKKLRRAEPVRDVSQAWIDEAIAVLVAA